jgi:hypothetical protein
MVDERSQEVSMFRAIRSSHSPSHSPTTLMTRVIAALPDLPHPHRKRHRRMGAAAIVRAVAGLVGVLVGIAAVVFRNKLVAIVSRGHGGEEEQAVPAGK